jgi:hypothetical protein
LTRHARGAVIAIAALVLTAGAAVAARPTTAPPAAASSGLDQAAEAAGKTVPVAVPVDLPDQPTGDEDAGETDPEGDAPAADAAEHPDNHGADVSAAAQGPTPESADNHGQYVRSVATANHGQTVAAEKRAAAAEKGSNPNR